jgi:hypothetical protein
MNERQGKNGSANVAIHDVLYRQITSSSDEAIKVALGLVDEAEMQVHVRCNPPLNARAIAIRMQAPMKPAIK